MKLVHGIAAALLLLSGSTWAFAEDAPEKKEEAAEPKKIEVTSEVVLSGLNNPTGVAVQPGTGTVFVAESAAGKIIRVKDGKAEDVVTGFPQDIYGKGPKYSIGPLGLAFVDAKTLVVGDGGLPDGQELLRIYDVPADGKSVGVDEMKHKLGPIVAGEQSKMGEGNFYGVAVTPSAIYVTCNGDDTKGWLSKIDWADGKPGELKPYIATKEATEVDAPVAIAINRKGHIVIGQMGEMNVPKDSLLTFYSPTTNKLLMKLSTGLYDIAGLAYSPSGRLYAVDYAWMAPEEGGLFRLDDDFKGGMTAVKVMSLDKPTSLGFAPDGTLYVTLFGTPKEGSDEKTGQLLKIKGNL